MQDERFTQINDTLSIGASIQNMLLRAEELGLGSLWIGNTVLQYRELTEYMQIDTELIGAVALGYKAENPSARPRKKSKRNRSVHFRLKSTVHFIRQAVEFVR